MNGSVRVLAATAALAVASASAADADVNPHDFTVFLPRESPQVNEHFHVLASPRSGDLLAFWTQESAECSDDMHICQSRSADGGRTWSEPTVFRGSPRHGSGVANAMWQLPLYSASGRLYVFWNERESPGPGMGVGYMKGAFSDDDGRTWSRPETAGSRAAGASGSVRCASRPGTVT